ncbi:MAG: hypothetical protein ACSHX8_11130 [Opitutaceae bacterium]
MKPSGEDHNNTPKPTYADAGRKLRVETVGCRANIVWHMHCEKHGFKFEPLADDRLSTRDSCCKPDCLTSGRATELMMYDWGDRSFPFEYLKVPYHKLRYGQDYPDGKFVMMNYHETHAVSVPMTEDHDGTEWVTDNYGKPMLCAKFHKSKCHLFPLGKVDPLRN